MTIVQWGEKMRHTRMAAAAVSIALFGVSASTGIAGADTPAGVGTTKTATTALDFQLGDLVGVRLLTDNAQASIDSKVVSQAEAFSRLTPLDINLLGTHIVPVPPLEARSTGAQKEAGLPATGGLAGVPAALGTGSLGAGLLSAVVDQNGAHSGLKLDLSNIKLAGGSLLDTGVLSNLTANAVHPDADGVRGVSVPTLKLLDVGALLKLLGIDAPFRSRSPRRSAGDADHNRSDRPDRSAGAVAPVGSSHPRRHNPAEVQRVGAGNQHQGGQHPGRI